MSYVTEEKIKVAYAVLRISTAEFLEASNKEVVLKTRLEKLRATALNDGTIEEIVGPRSNAEKREAAAMKLFANVYQELEDTQTHLQGARLALDLARIDVEEVRMLMRLSELEAGISNEAN